MLCPHWNLAEGLTSPFLCCLWGWAPQGDKPRAKAAGEGGSAQPWSTKSILPGAGVAGLGDRGEQSHTEGPPPGWAQGCLGWGQEWGGDGTALFQPPAAGSPWLREPLKVQSSLFHPARGSHSPGLCCPPAHGHSQQWGRATDGGPTTSLSLGVWLQILSGGAGWDSVILKSLGFFL